MTGSGGSRILGPSSLRTGRPHATRTHLAVGLLGLVAPPAPDDSIAPETVSAIKAATVYVRVEGDGWGGSGSGFVVATDDKGVLVTTTTTSPHRRPRSPTRREAAGPHHRLRQRHEGRAVLPATVLASDSDRDLAVLRVAG